MRLLSAVRALLVLIVISPSAVFAQSSPSASSPSVPRLINISGVFPPPTASRPARSRPSPSRSTPTRRAGRRSGRRRRPSRSMRQGRYSLLLGAHPGGRNPGRGLWLRRRPVAGHRVRARRRSRGPARPDHQRPVCAARRPTPTRSAAGRPPTTCWRPPAARTDGAAPPPSRPRPARAPISCCPARRTSSPST